MNGLTLTQEELSACRPVAGETGRMIRAYCPFHRSDHQRSLKVNPETGRFYCFQCDAWGYMAQARERWRRSAGKSETAIARPARTQSSPVRLDLHQLLKGYQAALRGSFGEQYLERRKIPLELAQWYGVGYALPGKWAHKNRDWKWGRLVFPHTDPEGQLINLYGRAVGTDEKVPKEMRHDHLPGDKGYFNAEIFNSGNEACFICEGPFDALSLIAAGHSRAAAIFGVNGWRWDWVQNVRELVFAMDADEAGQKWRDLARVARLRGKQVASLPPQAYGGCKDVNEAWVRGVLQVGEFPSNPEPTEPAPMPVVESEKKQAPDKSAAARLYPFLHHEVSTPLGTGILLQAFSSRCSVAFESDPDHVKFFKPEEISPIAKSE